MSVGSIMQIHITNVDQRYSADRLNRWMPGWQWHYPDGFIRRFEAYESRGRLAPRFTAHELCSYQRFMEIKEKFSLGAAPTWLTRHIKRCITFGRGSPVQPSQTAQAQALRMLMNVHAERDFVHAE